LDPTVSLLRQLKHDESTRGVSMVASAGGGILFGVMFFGVICLLGFAIYQMTKRVSCNCRGNRQRIEHSSNISNTHPQTSSIEVGNLSVESETRTRANGTAIHIDRHYEQEASSEVDRTRSQNQLLPPKTCTAQTIGSSPSSLQ